MGESVLHEVVVVASRGDDPREVVARQPVPQLLPRGTEGAEVAVGPSRGRGQVRCSAQRIAPVVVEEVEEGPPGTIHPPHQLMQIEAHTFCAVCGVDGKQLRRSALHLRCLRMPKNRYAGMARDRLMSGMVPHGRSWQQSEGLVTPFADD